MTWSRLSSHFKGHATIAFLCMHRIYESNVRQPRRYSLAYFSSNQENAIKQNHTIRVDNCLVGNQECSFLWPHRCARKINMTRILPKGNRKDFADCIICNLKGDKERMHWLTCIVRTNWSAHYLTNYIPLRSVIMLIRKKEKIFLNTILESEKLILYFYDQRKIIKQLIVRLKQKSIQQKYMFNIWKYVASKSMIFMDLIPK